MGSSASSATAGHGLAITDSRPSHRRPAVGKSAPR